MFGVGAAVLFVSQAVTAAAVEVSRYCSCAFDPLLTTLRGL